MGATFEMLKVAKADKIKVIQNEGVRSIDLNSSLYSASVDRLTKQQSEISNFMSKVAKDFKAILAKDNTNEELNEHINLNMKLLFSFDGATAYKNRNKVVDFGLEGKQHLKQAATTVLNGVSEDDELGFSIITNGDTKISPSDIEVSSAVDINKQGKTINKTDAWKKLRTYYNELKEKGVLNQ